MVFRMAGDPPIKFKAVDNGDGTYSLAVSGAGGGEDVDFITAVANTATITLTVTDGVLTAAVNAGQYAPASHVSATNNPHSVTKAQVGLGNVDNTSDLNKPISTATQTALNAKANQSTTYTKTEVDTALAAKANAADTYTKTEVDALVADLQAQIDALGA